MNPELQNQLEIEMRDNFGHPPTDEQAALMNQLISFMFESEAHPLFLLKGFAGTGKTSVLGALVKTMRRHRQKIRLLAPTGRAAKVLGSKSKGMALTIHKQIYRRSEGSDGSIRMALIPNKAKNTLFIVDEASMIGDYTLTKSGDVSPNNLLEDLLNYVYQAEGCRLIFLGDVGQLPPVGAEYSPALDKQYLQENFAALNIYDSQLTHVVRQSDESSILRNATMLRSVEEYEIPQFDLGVPNDVVRLQGDMVQEMIESSYGQVGQDETIIITRSNKRANLYNNGIRARMLWMEEELSNGDLLMAVKNNYFWIPETSPMGFIANGEIMRIKRVRKREEMYGFQFAIVEVSFVDYPEHEEVELLILLDALQVEAPSLPREDMKRLFFEVEKDYMHERNKQKRYQLILKNEYFNALQVKYAYAVTCHKSQGGQWANVFIDPGYFVPEMMDKNYLRWLYTAFTRATEKVYLMNFPEDFFS